MKLGLAARLAVLVAVTMMVMSFANPLWNLAVLCALVGLILCQRLPIGSIWPLLRASWPVFMLVGVCAAFATPDRLLHNPAHLQVLAQWGPLRFTVGGILMGCTFVLRMSAMIVATWMLIHDLSVDDVLDLAAHWRLPSWLSILFTSAMAAIPNLVKRREQIQQAQQARGQRADQTGIVQRWRANAAIVVPLITSSLVTAENLGVALSVRGYGAHRTMTAMHDSVRRPEDIAVSVVVLLLGIGAVAGRVVWGWGSL